MQVTIANCLATWRITSLIVNENGPYDVFAKFRDLVGIEYDQYTQRLYTNELAKMLGCFWCCSIWVALILVLGQRRPLWEVFAYSAGAIYLNYTIGTYNG